MRINIFGKEVEINTKIIIAAAIIALITVAAALVTVLSEKGEVIVKSGDIKQEESGDVQEQSSESGKQSSAVNPADTAHTGKTPEPGIRVYVSGCVKQIGVVYLKKGSIIEDAMRAAGGATSDADLEDINLAYELSDNDMVKIPSIKSKQQGALAGAAGNSGTAGNNLPVSVVKDSGGAVPGSSKQNSGSSMININTASAEELDTLPGIGIATAKDIIAYREKNGVFKTISDIMKVSGIKENKFNKIKDKICAD